MKRDEIREMFESLGGRVETRNKDYLKKYPKPDWAVDQIIRASGLVEDQCEHGIGHPNLTWMKEHDPDGKKCMGIHGCDGCCSKS